MFKINLMKSFNEIKKNFPFNTNMDSSEFYNLIPKNYNFKDAMKFSLMTNCEIGYKFVTKDGTESVLINKSGVIDDEIDYAVIVTHTVDGMIMDRENGLLNIKIIEDGKINFLKGLA